MLSASGSYLELMSLLHLSCAHINDSWLLIFYNYILDY